MSAAPSHAAEMAGKCPAMTLIKRAAPGAIHPGHSNIPAGSGCEAFWPPAALPVRTLASGIEAVGLFQDTQTSAPILSPEGVSEALGRSAPFPDSGQGCLFAIPQRQGHGRSARCEALCRIGDAIRSGTQAPAEGR